MSGKKDDTTITEYEAGQVERANAVGLTPVMFVHGLWLLPSEAKVDTENPHRGPLLLISGEKDHTVPWAITNASYKRQARNADVTEITEIPGRGHALTIDSGWRDVADTALAFVQRFSQPRPAET
jgi:alpha-beta hydrolase superfamily lysophospholipase